MTLTETTFAGTLPAIQRTTGHDYIYEGQTYPGVTGILKVLDKSGPLMAWAAKQTAMAAIEMHANGGLNSLLNSVGDAGAISALTSRSNWTRDTAAQLGTEIHALADLIVRGQPTPPIPEHQRNHVLHYAQWWKDSGWKLRLSEAVIVNPSVGYGGTFDLLAYDRDGRTVLADVKTGKGVYREAILQLAAYGMAPIVSPMGSTEAYPMPAPDRYVVLHVTAEGVRVIELNVGMAERNAFIDCVDLDLWFKSVKGTL